MKPNILKTLLPPATLIFVVLGSIIAGIATPTEAAGVGAFGALIITSLNGSFNLDLLRETSYKAATVTTMIFCILIGASIFSLIFRGVGGDLLVDQIFEMMPGGKYTALSLRIASNFPVRIYPRFHRNLLCHYSFSRSATFDDGL